ncbi:diacylglycerol kinase family lipid kinase [candidate division KSB1 bacterium]|nr:diacylglycerol kinase family lipid kinase [candidate division KSB1 bacterium]
MRIVLIYNSLSGEIKKEPELVSRMQKLINESLTPNDELISMNVQNTEPNSADGEQLVKGCDVICIAGGDGTISTTIDQTIKHKKCYAILPLGTFNNFVGAHNIPLRLEDAVAVVFEGKKDKVDLAQVNGRVIINNSSVGIYPKFVFIRQTSQGEYGLGKSMAMFFAFIKVLFLFPLIRVHLSSDDMQKSGKTSIALVSNNRYELNLLQVGMRKSLKEGRLYVYMAKCTTRWCVLRIALKALLSKLDQEKDFILYSAKEIRLESRKSRINVALDGEVYEMKTPLVYTIHPKELKIMVTKNE